MANNHIGTVLEAMQAIAEAEGWNYSHGDLDQHGLKTFTIYPLLHVTMRTVALGPQTSDIVIGVLLADRVNFQATEDTGKTPEDLYKEYGFTENSNYAHIVQQLYVKFSIQLRAQEQLKFSQLQLQKPINLSAIVEVDNDVLAGWQGDIVITVQSPWVTDGNC